MLSAKSLVRAIVLSGFGLALAACGGGGGGEDDVTYTIGGTVTGLTGAGLVLKNNGGNPLAITTNGNFTFSTPVDAGATYAVTVSAQPVLQVCEVIAASGTATAVVTNILVTCAAPVPHSIGGTVSGLTGTLVLRNNGGNDLNIAANGAFTFSAMVSHDATYAVAVQTSPAGQLCTVANAFGVATANVTNVTVTCSTPAPVPHTIGGTVSGLTVMTGLVLKNNGGDSLAITANGAFTFATPVNAGGTYAVTVSALPLGQFCAVAAGSGPVTAAVTSVMVSCVAVGTRSIGGNVSGLTGTVVLQVNGSNNHSVSTNGPFTFPNQVNNGPYVVRVLTQPAGQVCTVTNGSDNGFGGSASSNVTGVGIVCATPAVTTYSVGGSISGMTSSGLVLTLSRNGTVVEALAPLSANLASFAFTTPLSNGDAWAVAVTWQPNTPLNQACQVVGTASGTITAANISSVQVSCVNVTAAISGTVTMASSSLATGLVLRNNGGDDLVVPAGSATFQFATIQNVPSNFRVTIKSQPAGQTCTVVNGFGPASLGTQAGGTAVEVRCLNLRTVTPLSGVYTVAVTGSPSLPGYYLALFTDGTYLFTSREDAPGECSTNAGNGVEYGVYNFNAAARTLRFENAVVDTNGGCGLMEEAVSVRIVANAVQNSSTKAITGEIEVDDEPRGFTFSPIPSVAGQLLGAWTTTRLGIVIFRSDSTILSANAETSRSAAPTGMEEACFTGAAPTATSGTVTLNFSATCMPHGSPVIDTTGANFGYSAIGTLPVNFSISGNTLSFGSGTLPLILSRIVAE